MKFKSFFALSVLLAGCIVLPGCPTPGVVDPFPPRQVDSETGGGYYVYLPSGYHDGRAWPLVISCHGTPPWDVSSTQIHEWGIEADKHGFIILAPDLAGTDGIIGNGAHWAVETDEKRILNQIKILSKKYNVDLNNVMITGFSGGGFPTYWVGLRNPDVITCIVPRSANFSRYNIKGKTHPDAKSTPILIYHGSGDLGCIVAQSADALDFLQENGFNVSFISLPGVGHERRPHVAADFFVSNMNSPRPSFVKEE